MKKSLWIITILLITVIAAKFWDPFKLDNLRSLKNRHILRYFIEFPISPIGYHPSIPSSNSKEAKERGSFITDYQILPVINSKDSLVRIDLQEAFLEYKQVYKMGRDALINKEDSWNLVLVYTKRGQEMATDWNKKHYYYEMADRSFKRYFNKACDPIDKIYADTLILDIKDMFSTHNYMPYDVIDIWLDYTDLGKIMLIRNNKEGGDPAAAKWNVPLDDYRPNSFYYSNRYLDKIKKIKKDTNGVLGRPVPQETISSQYFVTEQLGTKHNGDTLIHRYKTPPVIDYQLNLVKLDFADVYLEKGENYNLVFVYSDEGKIMADKWNQDHGYHKLSWEKDGSSTLPLSPDTPLDTLLADTLVVNIKNLFKENPRQPQPDHVRKIWDELYQFGTITLVRE